MSRWRVLAISPGAQCSGMASYETDADAIALRLFAVVGYPDDDVDTRVARVRSALGRVLTRERPSLVVIEEPAEGHCVPPLLAALAAIHTAVESARIPTLRRRLVDARRIVCGALRSRSARTAARVIATHAPWVACYLPPPPPPKWMNRARSDRERYWSRAWTAAVLGLATAEENLPQIGQAHVVPEPS